MTAQATGTMPLMGRTLTDWARVYRAGGTPEQELPALLAQVRAAESVDGKLKYGSAWIELASPQQLDEQLAELQDLLAAAGGNTAALPLYGVPYAAKDNIDVKGFTTTAACPEYAYQPDADAGVIEVLKAAGAIVLGKTNLDQFATGLVGTRSPYGAVRNPFNEDYISGGSSSGSSVAVSSGYVAFSLGTDTAGSGRVPAGFNNIVGLKASKGATSTRGVVPACRSLDCVSVFSLNVADAERVLAVAGVYDELDPYSRPLGDSPLKTIRRLAVPVNAPWFGDDVQKAAYEQALQRAEAMGYELVPTDFTPLFELAALLYEGPWVAERYAAVGEFMEQDLPGLDPVVKGIVTGGKRGEQGANLGSAVDAFKAEYKRMDYVRRISQLFTEVDALFVPTSPRFPTQADLQAEPVQANSQMGTYTNFVNLADLAAVSVPADLRSDGLPFGVTLIAPAFSEPALLSFGSHWQEELRLPTAPVLLGKREDESVVVAVVGAHLTGMPLNHQLSSRHATLLEQTLTAKKYRLYALANTTPPKPGLVRVADDGAEIIVELWRLDKAAFGSFVEEIPQPLGIGTLELSDGRLVKGFICEPEAVASATDITQFGGWRAYIAQLNN
ncbi:MAG: allophanate hydrolase [Pseudomonadota bacterium]|nr:allophanate hydrolase [Pseudomonadota bacterium]